MQRSHSTVATAETGGAGEQPVVVHVPLRFTRRSGRKLMIMGDSSEAGSAQASYADPSLVKALVRAFRWQQRIDEGKVASISELAEVEGLSPTYVGRVLRLTLLAPDLIEQIVNGDLAPPATVKGGVSVLWLQQRKELTK